jgi:hypothetical protein
MISLSSVEVSVESGILVDAHATDRWGNSGSNGGNVVLTADGQTLSGDMIADSISSLTVSLENGSALTGAINADNTASEANVTLDDSSTWIVTADSYLATFSESSGISGSSISNVTGDGHTVYYDASLDANAALGGQTYTLVNGGMLTPMA